MFEVLHNKMLLNNNIKASQEIQMSMLAFEAEEILRAGP
jgi:hypothetical protein